MKAWQRSTLEDNEKDRIMGDSQSCHMLSVYLGPYIRNVYVGAQCWPLVLENGQMLMLELEEMRPK